MLEASDDLCLFLDVGILADYVVWGAPAGDDDHLPIELQIWEHDTFVDTSAHVEGFSLGRDRNGNDTDSINDWAEGGGPDVNFMLFHTKGFSNYGIPEYPLALIPTLIFIAVYARRRRIIYEE
jgi:hypothetical protein